MNVLHILMRKLYDKYLTDKYTMVNNQIYTSRMPQQW